MRLFFSQASPFTRKVRVSAHELGLSDRIELEREDLDGTFDIGAISIACALSYLDLRFASEGWRGSRPRLAEWAATTATRPSLAATSLALP